MSTAGISSHNCNNGGNRKRPNLGVQERSMIKNVFEGIRARNPAMTVSDAVDLCSILTKVSVRSVYRSLKNEESLEKKRKIETRGRKKIEIDDFVKQEIRGKIYEFYFKDEIPTLKQIQTSIAKDSSLPRVSRRVLMRTVKDMNFCYLKRKNRNSMLIETAEIVIWRRQYLRNIKECRASKAKVYYVLSKEWQNKNVTGETCSGAKSNVKEEPQRLIITHIGSESGFLENGLHMFEAQKTENNFQESDAEVFENWLESVLLNIEPGSVIVMEQAPYHNRRVEKLPTSAWRRDDIIKWLKSENIKYEDTMLKVELLSIVTQRKDSKYTKYVVDQLAEARDVTILRLPPYHCELSPIELMWTDMRTFVERNNTTSKLEDLKILFRKLINRVTEDSWSKCVLSVQEEEQRMWELDTKVEAMVEALIAEKEERPMWDLDTKVEIIVEPLIVDLVDSSDSVSESDSDSSS